MKHAIIKWKGYISCRFFKSDVISVYPEKLPWKHPKHKWEGYIFCQSSKTDLIHICRLPKIRNIVKKCSNWQATDAVLLFQPDCALRPHLLNGPSWLHPSPWCWRETHFRQVKAVPKKRTFYVFFTILERGQKFFFWRLTYNMPTDLTDIFSHLDFILNHIWSLYALPNNFYSNH